MPKNYNLPCNIAKTLDIIGDRWTLLIIRELLKGKTKFTELKEALEGLAPNILSDRLKLLEEESILTSNLYVLHPPRYSYELTPKGKELRHILNSIAIWGNRFLDDKYYSIVHPDCDHEVEVAYKCTHCNQTTREVNFLSN
ncbi:helix-turn-helix domain-containing protein [Ammoniphilus sp. CFH 90114]|uniref:winged helix-turn-helix transcriptional regulator n=1 Tax=Ammoniphilus sp. CFH 90114 TaxID=2493665 RepID=UPI00100F9087|nr:helix-turn-helix domain-containing protein [Ammoniphilus sp. CFH 90114]RXT07251.1 transcriptional regulator [Ammoniphilus sp. CFH 90114]